MFQRRRGTTPKVVTLKRPVYSSRTLKRSNWHVNSLEITTVYFQTIDFVDRWSRGDWARRWRELSWKERVHAAHFETNRIQMHQARNHR